MMKALYFPFTQIDRPRASFLAGHFGVLRVLNPAPETVPPETAALAAEKRIDLGVPASASGPALLSALQDFRQWATAHAGGDLAALYRQPQTPPFLDAHSAPRILAELRTGQAFGSQKDPAAKLHQALIFLLMAQELDACQQSLADDLTRTAACEREMLAMLSGEDDPAEALALAAGASPPTPISDYMLSERLRAWACLALASGVAADADAFWLVTDRSQVMEQILEFMPAEVLLDRHPLPTIAKPSPAAPVWPEWLAQAAAAADRPRLPDLPPDAVQDRQGAGHLTLVRIPGLALAACLKALSGTRSERSGAVEAGTAEGCTLVGCVAGPHAAAGFSADR